MSPCSWTFRPEPCADELLSSYLTRLAHRHGQSAYRYCTYHFPAIAIWNRDIDRTATDRLLSAISQKAGMPADRVADMTLRVFETRMRGQCVLPRESMGIAAWINAVGVYHRTRVRHGLQFCSVCLAESTGYRRIWRLSFVTVCPDHGQVLQDGCPHCDAPVVPHRNNVCITRCHTCGFDLRVTSRSVDRYVLAAAGELQSWYLEALAGRLNWVGDLKATGGPSDTASLFAGMRVVLRAIRVARRAYTNDQTERLGPVQALPQKCDELTRIDGRLRSAQAQVFLLTDWPKNFYDIAQGLRLTKRSFAQREPLADWVVKAIDALPDGVECNRTQRTRPLRLALRRLHRQKPECWRTQRAELMVKAARRGR